MYLALTLTLVVAAQADEPALRAPREPVILEVPALPASGETGVALDALAWASSFNGTPSIVGPAGSLDVEVVRTVDGPFFLQGIRPVGGFEADTRYSVLDPATTQVLTEFTTGTDATTPPPDAPNVTSAEQVFGDQTRTLRYGFAAFDDQYVFVNPDSTTDVRFANSIVTQGGLFEISAPQEGEVTTTFVAMNVAGVFSAAVTETHEAPAGCAQSSPSTSLAFALLLLLLTAPRAAPRSPCTRRPRTRSGPPPRMR